MNRFPTLLVAAAIAAAGIYSAPAKAAAPEPRSGDAAAADALLARVEQTTKALTGFRADAYVEVGPAPRPSGLPLPGGRWNRVHVSFLRPNLFTAEYTESGRSISMHYVSNGSAAYMIKDDSHRSLGTFAPDASDFNAWVHDNEMTFLTSGSASRVLFEAPVPPIRKMLPDETWNGDTYQVVECDVGGGYPITYKFYIGRDSIVHRILQVDDNNGKPLRFDAYVLNFEANPALAAGDFAVKGVETPPPPLQEWQKVPATGAVGAMAPPFSLPTPTGERISLADALKGKKAVLVNFWFVHCPPCRAEHPKLEALYNELKDKGLGVIAIDDQDTPESVAKYLKGAGLTFPTVLDGKRTLPDHKSLDPYGVHSCPTNILVDATGRIVSRTNEWEEDQLRKDLAALDVK